MKHLCFLLLLIFTILASALPQKQQHTFSIAGKTIGIADSTVLYLDDASNASVGHIDSALVMNNLFSFSGILQYETELVIIHTSDDHEFNFFWLEASAITFQAEKGKFGAAVITGSATQHLQDQLNDNIKKTGQEKEQNILFIQHHPNSIISVSILCNNAAEWGKDSSEILYRHFSAKLKHTAYGKKILAFITLNRNIKVGDRYADFSQPDINGNTVSLSDFKGKVVLLEFWGSWCGPCRKGNPELLKIYGEFKNKGFDILGVAADDKKDEWAEAVQKDSLVWKNVCDLGGDKNKAVLIYGIFYYPANFLIDKKGYIIAKDLSGEALRKKLAEIL